jgi:hypothetical protein
MGLEIRVSTRKIKTKSERIGGGKQSQRRKRNMPMQKPQPRISSKMTNHSAVIQPPNTSQQSIHIPPTQKKKKKTQTGNGERNSTLNKVGRAYEETNAKSKQGLEIGRGEPTYSAALNPKLRLLLLFLSIVFKQNNNLRCFPLMLSNQTCGQCGKKTQTFEVKKNWKELNSYSPLL